MSCRLVERRKSVSGNNAADGCHFCYCAPTISSFQEIVSLGVVQEEDALWAPAYPGRTSPARCLSEWVLSGDNIGLMEERAPFRMLCCWETVRSHRVGFKKR